MTSFVACLSPKMSVHEWYLQHAGAVYHVAEYLQDSLNGKISPAYMIGMKEYRMKWIKEYMNFIRAISN